MGHTKQLIAKKLIINIVFLYDEIVFIFVSFQQKQNSQKFEVSNKIFE